MGIVAIVAGILLTKLQLDDSSPWTSLFIAQLLVIVFFVFAAGWQAFSWP